jgi:hypothetical protein
MTENIGLKSRYPVMLIIIKNYIWKMVKVFPMNNLVYSH